MKPLVIALGGNALIREKELGNYAQQLHNVTRACKDIATLAREDQPLVITHGNGPQVGNLELQMNALSPRIPTMPLHVEVGMTQGEIGHLIFLGMKKWLPKKEITPILTHVEVDAYDVAFKHPSKPIGPWYASAQHLKREKIPFIHDVRKGFRKVVASPLPKKIIEMDAIEQLLEQNHIVIAGGGGGIPVVRKNNSFAGADAVIDKDFTAQTLANALGSREMVILTNEAFAYENFSGKSSTIIPLPHLRVKKALSLVKKGEFGKGSMEPKIRASVRFIQKGGKTAYIGKTGQLEKVLHNETGTRITH